jgi:hypothetical protein
MIKCPNYILCKNNDNTHNGVCFNCNSSIWGYEHRKYMITNFNKPSAVYELTTSATLDADEFVGMMIDLFEERDEVGKLVIVDEKRECPCCFKESVVNVVNPFCGNTDHTVCGDCFKKFFRNEFVDDLVDIPRPYCIQEWNEYFKSNLIYQGHIVFKSGMNTLRVILVRWLNMFITKKNLIQFGLRV